MKASLLSVDGVTLILAVAMACGRPDIDPEPYSRQCDIADDCPAPYECVEFCEQCPEGSHPMHCFVPCHDDGDCPERFRCNSGSETQPVNYCYYAP